MWTSDPGPEAENLLDIEFQPATSLLDRQASRRLNPLELVRPPCFGMAAAARGKCQHFILKPFIIFVRLMTQMSEMDVRRDLNMFEAVAAV